MPIGTGYTGKGTRLAVPDYSKTQRATEQAIQGILGAQKQKLDIKRQEESQFLEALNVDPISVASQQLMNRQAEAMDEYTKKWSARMSERGGIMDMHDKAEMAADKQKMIASQGQWQASNKRWLNDVSRYREGVHDADALQEATQRYFETGEYRGDGLQAAAMAPDDYERTTSLMAKEFREGFGTDVDVSGGVVRTTPTGGATDEQIRSKISSALALDSYRKKLENDFMGLQKTKRREYLDSADKDNDGVDIFDRKNAVIEFEVDRTRHRYQPGLPKEKPKTVPYWQAREAAEKPESKVKVAVRTGRGDGETKGTSFAYAEEGLSSNYLGTGIEGIGFGYTDDVLGKWGVQVPVSTITNKPKGAEFKSEYVLARPVIASNGEIEWVAYGGKQKEITATEYFGNSTKDGYFKAKNANGESVYYKIENLTNIPITTDYASTSGLVDLNFQGFSDVAKSKGIDKTPEGKVKL
jgi:hypothetical protein